MRRPRFRWPVSRAGRLALVGACAVAMVLGVVTGAYALWSTQNTARLPAVLTGNVSFAASTQDAPGDLVYSVGGGAVRITLPGAEVARVLEQTGVDPDPIIWTFTASGWADGITGLVYDVAVTSQVAADGSTVDLASGVADADTLLHYSTTKVYPAAVNGDCSTVPDAPAGRDIYVFGLDDDGAYRLGGEAHVLQAPGARAPGGTAQVWCVAIAFDAAPDGEYVNDAQATGTGLDGWPVGAVDSWRVAVAFPPSLPSLGDYYNLADVWGVADDETISRAQDFWGATLYPDPSGEPGVTITLDPAVTSSNPDVVQPSDHFARTGT